MIIQPFAERVFHDSELRKTALRHRSTGASNNERLEFLGDAVLNLVIAEALFERLPQAEEGDLTRLRAHLVCGDSLAGMASELNLAAEVELGPGELKSGGHNRGSILADALEALIGALYLDAGFAVVKGQILQLFASRLDDLPSAQALKDSKTLLQEKLQAEARERPSYELVEESGPQHRKNFRVQCRVELQVTAGEGGSRRQAEQEAAREMLRVLSQ